MIVKRPQRSKKYLKNTCLWTTTTTIEKKRHCNRVIFSKKMNFWWFFFPKIVHKLTIFFFFFENEEFSFFSRAELPFSLCKMDNKSFSSFFFCSMKKQIEMCLCVCEPAQVATSFHSWIYLHRGIVRVCSVITTERKRERER